jgi:hypothetical protein
LCASAQVEGGPGQYIARSATTGWSATTDVATAALASRVSSVSTLMVRRPLAGTVLWRTTVWPPSVRNVTVRFAGAGFGLPTRTNVSKNAPVAPSARNHDVDPAVTPADSCPPSNSRAVPKYMARSATMGTVASTTIEKELPTSSGMALAATVTRAFGGIVSVRTNGVARSRRNVSVTSEGAAPALARSTNVWKKPSEPSAKSQRVLALSTAVPPCDP